MCATATAPAPHLTMTRRAVTGRSIRELTVGPISCAPEYVVLYSSSRETPSLATNSSATGNLPIVIIPYLSRRITHRASPGTRSVVLTGSTCRWPISPFSFSAEGCYKQKNVCCPIDRNPCLVRPFLTPYHRKMSLQPKVRWGRNKEDGFSHTYGDLI